MILSHDAALRALDSRCKEQLTPLARVGWHTESRRPGRLAPRWKPPGQSPKQAGSVSKEAPSPSMVALYRGFSLGAANG